MVPSLSSSFTNAGSENVATCRRLQMAKEAVLKTRQHNSLNVPFWYSLCRNICLTLPSVSFPPISLALAPHIYPFPPWGSISSNSIPCKNGLRTLHRKQILFSKPCASAFWERNWRQSLSRCKLKYGLIWCRVNCVFIPCGSNAWQNFEPQIESLVNRVLGMWMILTCVHWVILCLFQGVSPFVLTQGMDGEEKGEKEHRTPTDI